MLPLIESTRATCAIVTLQSSLISSSVSTTSTGFVNDPVLISPTSYYKVTPQDDTLDMTYTCYVLAKANGGEFAWTSKLTLHVGCVPLEMMFKENINLVTSIYMDII